MLQVNRLAAATSPYLLQHADNPVDWHEWGAEAFAEARERDVPLLISVGYSACHWCHVMAHQSFEDEQVAAVVNATTVPVKVDREERPDVDAVYMAATQATTGHGGWPMTVFATPDGEPIFCGTYFPRDHFLQVVTAVDAAWRDRRDDVLASSTRLAEAIRGHLTPPTGVAVDDEALAAAVLALARTEDREHGGFGGAPKFPPSMVLEQLLRHHARTGDRAALDLAARTGEAMARGGIYDQLAGGFARYAVDAQWVVPHFEKMLYDNALLMRFYVHWWRATGDALAGRIAEETADFVVRDLGTAHGGFASALDADTDGVEGLTYAWTPAQLTEVLGPDDGPWVADLLDVTDEGTFEHGTSTLRLRTDPDGDAAAGRWARARERLLAARAERPQPGRDDKVVTAWNGLAIAGLAEVGVLLDRRDLLEAATRCADHLLGTHLVDDGDGPRLRRSSRDGVVGAAAAVADDHGDLAEGLLTLHQATGDPRWLRAARDLVDTALARFTSPEGAVHDTADDAEALFARPHSSSDGAEPSGQSALAGAALTLGALTGDPSYLQAADRALHAAGAVATREPRFAGWALAVAEARAAGPVQVAVVTPGPDDARGRALLETVRASPSPGLVLAYGAPDTPDAPLLAGRPLVDGGAAAYVCRGFVCDRPVTTPEELAAALAPPAGAQVEEDDPEADSRRGRSPSP
ncbi:thioredoxin domain-containing protein [Lapillicoccus jejuensis]